MTTGQPYEDPETARRLLADELDAEERRREEEALTQEALSDAPSYADRRGI